jgi:branched-subunit amino acid transport protein
VIGGVVLFASGLLTWMLRVGFIVILPARRLPSGVRRLLDQAAIAALAALLGTALAGQGGPLVLVTPSPVLGAAVAGLLVAWRTRRMGLTVVAAVAVLWLLQLLTGGHPYA